MYVALAALLLALGAFTTTVVTLIKPDPQPAGTDERLRGFGYVGALGAFVVAAAVLIVGVAIRNPRLAESIALLGLFGFVAYQLAAWAIIAWPTRRPRNR